MAEVFGTISAAIGVLDVSTRGVQRLHHIIKTWNNAPAELLALTNEIEDLKLLLSEIDSAKVTIEDAAQQDAGFVAALGDQLSKAEKLCQSLSDTINELTKLKKYEKKANWVRREGRVENLKREFRQVREHINALLTTHNV